MKKLLQINITANSGSSGHIAEGIGETVISHGWESYIAYGRSMQPSKSKLIKIGDGWDIMWHGLQSRLFDNHGLASKNATHKLIRQIKELAPDIIHLQNIHGYYLNYRILFEYLSQLSIPIVWTLHDCWAFTGHCGHYLYSNCNNWKTGCVECPGKHVYPATFCVSQSKRNYELKKELFNSLKNLHIIAVSKWLADEVRESFLKDHDIRYIYNGVDLNVFQPKSIEKKTLYAPKPNDKIILCVSSVWYKEKGLNDIVELRKLLPDNYVMIVVGLSTRQIRHLPNGIVGIERTENAGVLAELYSIADCFVNPSRAETFGLTTVEALACGTPVIVYNTSACPEIVDEKTGIVLPAYDVNALADAVISVCNSNVEHYQKACRDRAAIYFNKDKCYENYLSLYNEIL